MKIVIVLIFAFISVASSAAGFFPKDGPAKWPQGTLAFALTSAMDCYRATPSDLSRELSVELCKVSHRCN